MNTWPTILMDSTGLSEILYYKVITDVLTLLLFLFIILIFLIQVFYSFRLFLAHFIILK